jgi:2',3'-cyclic-nucleotide 2'-phosphodiesterase (5'-nucleotidase family)
MKAHDGNLVNIKLKKATSAAYPIQRILQRALYAPVLLLLISGLTGLAGCGLEGSKDRPEAIDNGDTLRIAVMATTDVHGRLRAWDYYRNQEETRYALSKVATLVDSVRNVYSHTLLLDAGDWLQGNPFAEYFAMHDPQERHYPFLTAADYMAFDAIVLGNHEFNFGLEYLDRQIEMTMTPIIGANIYRHGTFEPAYQPYVIRDFNGARVAVIGLTTPGSAVWDRPRVEGKLDFGDGVEAANRFVAHVREEYRADVVIILAHSGLDGRTSYHRDDLGEENFGRTVGEGVPGVDLLVLGHTHRAIDDVRLEGVDGRTVGVIQPGRWASHLGIAELKLVLDEAGSFRVADVSTINHSVENVKEHPEIVQLTLEAHDDVVAFVTEPMATTDDIWSARDARRNDTPIIGLIQVVQKKQTGAQLSAAAAFNTSVTFGPGPITRGDIALLYPYFNTLYKLEVTGEQIRSFLEHTSQYYTSGTDAQGRPVVNREWPGFNFDMLAGADYVLDLRNPPGERVVNLTFNGEPIASDDRFTMAVNSYRAEGGGGFHMLKDAPVLMTINRSVGDMILDFLKEKEVIRHDDVFDDNWQLAY